MAKPGAEAVYNFCSGPAMLPAPVLAQAQRELTDYQGHGVSVMELSHRSEEFLAILHSAEHGLRSLMHIPDHYHVLFTSGGASPQFSAVPLNLLSSGGAAGFINTGYWSQKAMAEAARFGRVVEVASSADSAFKSLPVWLSGFQTNELDYLHYTPNETIGGVELFEVPELPTDTPLVADMSSCILSRPFDVEQFGLIYAGAQKNIGPAGLGVVIVREDLLGSAQAQCPRLLNYQTLVEARSMANTPPTFAIYLADLVFQWCSAQGGVPTLAKHNLAKSDMLYDVIDRSSILFNDIEPKARSRMNVPFFFHDKNLESSFLAGAQRRGLLNLAGHRSAGGCRASIYNAMPLAGVQALTDYMIEFENTHV
ncbi:3-phosphoserine/phosphohydroxythreonine transaminase [Reinekea blandensis]|uniref:Phosphoserine aminotransferase n=1 Tax=Reinekea blandensis MED297 TaxID=314283 RepID=A4BJI0_9GAMM|nr:3-phosphoserine/phosphohydroxythreonine transaminase [Reinekea blandensis]EAR07752.1 phosphoserine aminotransferase [Reinekea sp. MED297] [Reinekea blandensis MED297]